MTKIRPLIPQADYIYKSVLHAAYGNYENAVATPVTLLSARDYKF